MEITSQTLRQVVKYGVVGLANTLLTALVIWVCMELFLWDPVVSNVVGYAIGLINSFVWNRRWTFRSNASMHKAFLKFGVSFAVCYAAQLAVLIELNDFNFFEPYYNQLLAMVFYTALNFVCNKYFTFNE